jgi:hypothetical protein
MLVEDAAPALLDEWAPLMLRAGRDPVTGIRLVTP